MVTVETCIAANPLMHILLLGLKVGPTGLCLGCSGRPTRVARLYIVTLVRRSVGAISGFVGIMTWPSDTLAGTVVTPRRFRVLLRCWPVQPGRIRPHVVAHGLRASPWRVMIRPYG